jgi:DNA-binding HxlR family transcriptional regulator
MIEVGEDELIRLIFDVRQVFRGDWAGPVLVVLRRGSMQYRELRDEMGHYSFFDRWSSKERTLSNSELARTLTRMTQDGLLIRTERPGEWHRAVSYELSVEGRQMIERFTPLLRWAADRPDFFERVLDRRTGRGDQQGQSPDQEPPSALPS